ncbi:hypothetical protein HMPREF2141_03031 [Bacteroides uniformis]|nr:hypothetical protein HMPREF2141_03031 [Bacteroides uniformis]
MYIPCHKNIYDSHKTGFFILLSFSREEETFLWIPTSGKP